MEQLRQDSQLQEYFLRLPAKSALKCLQVLYLGARASEIMGSQHDFGPDRASILRISLAVRRGEYRSEDMELLDNNRLLDYHIEQLLYNLDEDRMLKLALLTWHFDASSQKPYEELFRFSRSPMRNARKYIQGYARDIAITLGGACHKKSSNTDS
ncbi:hypothetical protein AbraIFM66950_002055 [Aspergillus brasiliensis]|nr:hypothetical protein AbraIFM66950_002055 [Aspergillus brasiliensis]